MGVYNPNIPRVVGEEWVPIRDEGIVFSPSINTVEYGHTFTPTANRVLQSGKFYVNQFPASVEQDQVMLIGVYPTGREGLSGPVRSVIIPCNNAEITGSVDSGSSAPVPQVLLTPGDNFYMRGQPSSNVNPKRLALYFAVNQFSQLLANKRILKVELIHQLSWDPTLSGTGTASSNPPFLDAGVSQLSIERTGSPPAPRVALYSPLVDFFGCGLNFLGSGIQLGLPGQVQITTVNMGEINPASGPILFGNSTTTGTARLPWRYEDLALFEISAGVNRYSMIYDFGATNGTWAGIYYLGYAALRVTFCEEQRVAYGGAQFGNFLQYLNGANAVPMFDTHYNQNPVIIGGTQYTVTVSAPDIGDIQGPIIAGITKPASANGYPTLSALRELDVNPVHVGIKVNLTQTEGEVFSRETTHVLPQLSLHTSGGPVTEVHVYGRQARGQVFGSVTASQNVQDGTLGLFGARAQGLTLPGGSGNYVSTPDNAALDIVGDIDLRADIQTNDWTANGGLITKWGAAGVRSYEFAINPDGTLSMVWSTDGTSVQFANSTIPVPALDGQRLAVRATLDVDNGAAGKTVQFFTAPTAAGPYTQLGASVTSGGTTSIFSGAAQVEVGSHTNGTGDVFTGTVYSAEIRNSIGGTLVANPIFSAQPPGTTSFTDAPGRTWTLHASAAITAATSFTFPQVRFYARRFGNTTVPLTLSSPVITGTGTSVSITPPQFDALPEILDGWKQVDLRFSGTIAMGSIPDPQWTWSASGELQGNRWEVLGATAPALSGTPGSLFTLAPNGSLSSATYGQPPAGAAINMSWMPQYAPPVSGSASDQTSDAVLMFGQDMPLVTGFTLTQSNQPLSGIGLDCNAYPWYVPRSMSYNQLTWSTITPSPLGGVVLPAVPGNYISTPDTASLDITGDIDLRADFSLPTWAPTGINHMLIAKWIDGGQRAYLLWIDGNGDMRFNWSADGVSGFVAIATVQPPVLANGARQAVRVTFDVDNGASGHTATFYTAPTIDGPWTQLGAPVTAAGVTSLFNSNSIVEVGSLNSGTTDFGFGTMHAIEIRNGINGTLVANPKFWNNAPTGATSFTDSFGLVWTINGGYQFSGFEHYEIQRMDTISTDWKSIAYVQAPLTSGFRDYEARVGILTSYRIRGISNLLFTGPWSTTVTGTLAAPGVTGIGMGANAKTLLFTTNEVQSGASNLAYALAFESDTTEEFKFPEAAFNQYQLMYNRDFQVAFRPLERGGETFSRTILVQAAAISPPTLADFTSLRNLAWDDTSYVCVRDEDGNRWFANVTVPTGRVKMNNRELYLADINVIEVTQTPSVVLA
jgi:hypothetical protein